MHKQLSDFVQQVAVAQGHTPFYVYDLDVLRRTLVVIKNESSRYGFKVHYALKANANDLVLGEIRKYISGADCVSGNEVVKAANAGFDGKNIMFAGVGKSDREIDAALDLGIFCFNCESVQELEVINERAQLKNTVADVALRINPGVNAHTHHYITTGLEENKFGINPWELQNIIDILPSLSHTRLMGLHFHIGSQITDLQPFRSLCIKVNEMQEWFALRNIFLPHINVGGGLGIDYHQPDTNEMPDFAAYFGLFHTFLKMRPGQQLHFELGRAVIAQCGSLISKVLYVKKGVKTNFIILDAGMTELIRPALYQAYHCIENISRNNDDNQYLYDVVGPICESSDTFGKSFSLPETFRGDLIAIRSTGAYGEVMASSYNLREKAAAWYYVPNDSHASY